MPAKLDLRERLLLLALLSFVAGLCLQPITESDVFFRLRVGQEILAHGGLLGRNWFSFTAPDHPDLDLSWAFEVGLALLYRLGGFAAVLVGKTLVIVAVFAGAFAICRRRGAGAVATTIALAAAALVMRERFVERPHVVSFAGEMVVLAAIAALGRRWSWRALLGFALAMVVWANAHAGIFTGVLMLVLAVIGTLVALGWLPADTSHARRGALLTAIVVGAACMTPVGPVGIVRYLALHVTLPRLHAIDEFRNATWRSDGPFIVWLLAVTAVVALSYLWRRRSARDAWTEVLPAAGMTLLGLVSVRFAGDAVLVTAPLLAVRLSVLSGSVPDAVVPPRARRAIPVLMAAALLIATAWPRLGEVRMGRPVVNLDVDWSTVPLDAIRFVEANGLRERMYNDFEIGSYLLFQGYPRYRVFVDPRLPAYPEEMHRLLGAFDLDRDTWDAAMSKYGVETALLGYAGINRRVAWWDPERWALVYRAADTRVFVRRLGKWKALIAAREIPATFDFAVETGATTRPLEVMPALSPVPDCEWQQRLGDLIFDLDRGSPTRARPHYERAVAEPHCLAEAEEARLTAWLGAMDLGGANWQGALAHLERALALAPGDLRTRANRATALERLGRRAEAAADWSRVGTEARGTPLGDAATARARSLTADQ